MKKIITSYDKIEATLAGLLLGGVLIICLLEVVVRYIFSFSFFWAKEYILYCMIWSVFLASSHMLKKGAHIRMTLFIDYLPPNGRLIIELVTTAAGIVFCIFFFVSGIELVMDSIRQGFVSTSLAKTPLWIPQLIAPIAGFLFAVRFVERLIVLIKEYKEVTI